MADKPKKLPLMIDPKTKEPIEAAAAFLVVIPKNGGAPFASSIEPETHLVERAASLSDMHGACAGIMKDASALEFSARFGEIYKASRGMTVVNMENMTPEQRIEYMAKHAGREQGIPDGPPIVRP